MRNGKQLHITSEEATGDRLNDRIRSIEYVRAGERINAASAPPPRNAFVTLAYSLIGLKERPTLYNMREGTLDGRINF